MTVGRRDIRPRPSAAELGAAATGVFFAACAAGNAVGTLPRSATALAWFRDGAWLPPYRVVLERLVPVAAPVVGATVVFEAVVAAMLLGRRHQEAGLWLAAGWVVGVSPAVAPPYWLANAPQALLYAGLAHRLHTAHDGRTARRRQLPGGPSAGTKMRRSSSTSCPAVAGCRKGWWARSS